VNAGEAEAGPWPPAVAAGGSAWAGAPATRARPPGGPTILVVDDDRPLDDLLAIVFEVEGYRVDRATSGRDALATLERAAPDVVLAAERFLRLAGGLGACLLALGVPVLLLDPLDVDHPAFPGAGVVTTPPDIALLLALVSHLLARRRVPGARESAW
jgi:DNA-binding response OmpR family regulator